MTDYSDYKVWKDEELTAYELSLSEYEEYTPEGVLEITTRLMEIAKEQGLEGCYLKFQSNREPYEDCLSSASVIPCGYRKLSVREIKEYERQEAVQKKAEELNITFYEADVVVQLQDRGII